MSEIWVVVAVLAGMVVIAAFFACELDKLHKRLQRLEHKPPHSAYPHEDLA